MANEASELAGALAQRGIVEGLFQHRRLSRGAFQAFEAGSI
jgi:hypothetical protein